MELLLLSNSTLPGKAAGTRPAADCRSGQNRHKAVFILRWRDAIRMITAKKWLQL